ncbi:MAG: DUF3857 domain-containing protein [Bacteroidota bacterium]
MKEIIVNLMYYMNIKAHIVSKVFVHPILFVLIIMLIVSNSFSQDIIDPPPIEWGDVSTTEFELEVPEFSPNATSLTICKYGQVYVSEGVSSYETRFDVHERFIVLHNFGVKRADISILFWTGPNKTKSKGKEVKQTFSGAFRGSRDGNKVEKLDACVYNLDSDGKIVTSTLSSDQIFVQDYSDIAGYGAVTFALPNVKVGSIIEYKYTIVRKHLFTTEDWYFQSSDPCLHSEFRVSYPDKNAYAIIKKGLLKDEITFNPSSLSSINIGRKYDKVYSYELDSVPGLPDEPYVMSMNNIRTQMLIQMSEHYNSRTNVNEKIISTWKLLANEYKYDDQFGRQLNRNGALFSKLDPVWIASTSDKEKVKKCYNFVRDYFTCNNKWRTTIRGNLKEIFESKKGSAVEINLFLAGLLKKAGFEPKMALVSTRSHGTINEKYPFVSQFNHAICILEIDGKTLFLDASVKQGQYSFSPAIIVGCKAFIVDPKNPVFVEVTTNAKYDKFVMCTGKIEGDSLVGKLQFKFKGYAAARQRKIMQSDSAEYFNDVINGRELLELSNPIMINTRNADKPFLTQVDYSKQLSRFSTNEMLYINPYDVYGSFKNDFKSKTREFPVEFNYTYKVTYMYSITIPDGYVIEDIPNNKSTALADKSASVSFTYQASGSVIQIKTELKINKIVFYPEQYTNLKTLFELWELKHDEMIVLRKVT